MNLAEVHASCAPKFGISCIGGNLGVDAHGIVSEILCTHFPVENCMPSFCALISRSKMPSNKRYWNKPFLRAFSTKNAGNKHFLQTKFPCIAVRLLSNQESLTCSRILMSLFSDYRIRALMYIFQGKENKHLPEQHLNQN